jgi:hypothetical protein
VIFAESRKVTESLRASLLEKMREARSLGEELADTRRALDREQSLRIGAEAIAAERKVEIERLLAQLSEANAGFKTVISERLKSLDAINLKLMEPRPEEKIPDINLFKREAQQEVFSQTVQRVRQMHRDIDRAVIAKLHPKFSNVGPNRKPVPESPGGITTNGPMPEES